MPRRLFERSRLLWQAALCAAWVTSSVAASAQQPEDPSQVAARALGYAGIDAYEAGDFDTAAQRLEAAYTALRVPSLGLWSARALQKQGRWVAAEQRLREVTQLQLSAGDLPIQRQAQADAKLELEQLQAKLPRLTLRLRNAQPNEVQLTLDGNRLDTATAELGLAVDPGERHFMGVKGDQQAEAVVIVAAGEQKEAVLTFPAQAGARAATKSPASPSEATRSNRAAPSFVQDTLPWILVGTGGAALATGAVTLTLAVSDATEIDDNPNCRQRRCLGSESALVNRFNTLRTVSDVALIGGTLLAAAGVTLWVLDDSSFAATQLQAGPSTLWLTGAF